MQSNKYSNYSRLFHFLGGGNLGFFDKNAKINFDFSNTCLKAPRSKEINSASNGVPFQLG